MSNVPTTFAERLKERINDQIVDLLPAEQIDELVQVQLDYFMGHELPDMIKKLIREQANEMIREQLRSAELQPLWNPVTGMAGPSAVVKEIMTEHGHAIFASVVSSMAQQVVMTMANNAPRLY